jgi:hypothetical protein
MPTPTNLVLFTWQFDLVRLAAAEDIAEFSIAASRDDIEPDQGGLDKLAVGAVHAFLTSIPATRFAPNVRFTGVKARMFKADGHTLRESVALTDTPWVGLDPGNALPWETSLCCSIYAYPRGTFTDGAKRKRGRFYLPPMAASQLDASNSGYFANGNVTPMLTSLKSFVNKIGQDDLGVSVLDAGIWSRADGVVRSAVQISMDAKFDSQRRRQNREIAGIATADLAP